MRFFTKLTIFIFLLILPASVAASEIYLESSTDKFGPGDNFSVNVKIDTPGVCVNTVDIYVEFPSEYLKVKDFLSGESVLSLWIDKPGKSNLSEINQNGVFHFSGGIPGGYCGVIPGDPGESNILGSIIFEAPSFVIGEWDNADISIKFGSKSKVLLNDGLGTEDSLDTKNLTLKVHDSSTMTGDDYLGQIKNDNIPPEPFVIYLQGGNSVFNGANYVEFNTTDKQTGVDHYEILEIWENEKVGVPSKRSILDYFFKSKRVTPEWKVVESPYLLQDQDLRSIIKLRAVDKAGNERYVEYIPKGSLKIQQNYSVYRKIFTITIMVALATILLVFCFILVKKLRSRRKARQNENIEEGLEEAIDVETENKDR